MDVTPTGYSNPGHHQATGVPDIPSTNSSDFAALPYRWPELNFTSWLPLAPSSTEDFTSSDRPGSPVCKMTSPIYYMPSYSPSAAGELSSRPLSSDDIEELFPSPFFPSERTIASSEKQ